MGGQLDHHRGAAVGLLTFYLKRLWEKAGLTWDSDNDAELEILVDNLIAAANVRADEIAEERAAL